MSRHFTTEEIQWSIKTGKCSQTQSKSEKQITMKMTTESHSVGAEDVSKQRTPRDKEVPLTDMPSPAAVNEAACGNITCEGQNSKQTPKTPLRRRAQ